MLLRQQVASELEAVAETHGTPRRTLLLNARPAAPKPKRGEPADLQIADGPTLVALSTTGRAVRIDVPDGQQLTVPSRRSMHDAILATARGTIRGELGALTSRGRILRFSPIDLPSVPPTSIQLSAGQRLRDYVGLVDSSETILTIVSLESDVPIALGTQQGVVKRIVPSGLPVRPEQDVVSLKPGDRVVGAAEAPDDAEVVFVTRDAQLLRFAAANVRPQGAPAGGMAGIKLPADGAVVFFGVVSAPDAVVVTISGDESAIAGTDPGRAKISDFSEFPAKGRATAGVRAHTLLKGESALTLAWVGPDPAHAVDPTGAVRRLPESLARRDASGQPLDAVVGSIGRTLA